MKIIEDNESGTKYYCDCKKCNEPFMYESDDTWWIEHGMYSEKVTNCSHCGCINVIEYQNGFNQNPNYDNRYFD